MSNESAAPEAVTELLVTATYVAERFGVTTQTVARWAREDKIASVRTPGGQLRFRREDVDGLLEPEAEAS